MDYNAAMIRAGAILTVDLDALCANYRLLRERARPAHCAAVLKSNAYGLGALPVGRALYEEGCRHFFVAHLDEGIALRPFLPDDADIFVLHGPPPGAERECRRHRLIPVLNSIEQIQAWRRLARSEGCLLPAFVQIDSGMSRMGLSAAEVAAWIGDPGLLDGVDVRFLMSHLACADEPDNAMNRRQLANFVAARRQLPACPASLSNSSAIFLSKDFHFDLVRPGAALYGIAPRADGPNPMAPVVRLQGRILQTRRIAAGDHVGYALRYTANAPRLIATVGIGYADGWSRSMSNRGAGFIDGQPIAQVGTISMDSTTFDVTGLAPDQVVAGGLVDLICPQHPVDAVAAIAGTIGYEVLTGLGPRIHRQYLCSGSSDSP
ncbi:MAG: alanine racemase [Massilia sp.]